MMPPPDEEAQSTAQIAAAQPTAFISNVPLPPRLELHGNLAQNWSKWRQVWTAYKTVTNLISQPSPFRVAAFITCIGPDALDIHNGLAFENELDKNNIDKILDLWNSYCLGETNVIYERFKFNNRSQTPDESVDAYAAALRAMAATCNFGNLRDELIRDRIVCGISHIAVQQKLLQEPKLTLNRCLDIARSAETTTAQLKVITGHIDDSNNEVHAEGKWQRNQNTNGPRRNVISDCKYCGGEHGWKKEYCPAYGKICDHCGKKNHFAATCLQRKHAGKRDYNTTPRVHAVSKSPDDILCVDYDAQGHLHIHTVSKSQYKSKLFAQIILFDQTITMQIDSGASCNVLPEKYVPLGTEIQHSKQSLTLYSKASLPVVGTCNLQIKNPRNALCYDFPFVVIKGDYMPLLGSQAAQQMQLITVQFDNIDEPSTINCFSCSSAFPSQTAAREPFPHHEANVSPSKPSATGLTREYIMKNYADVFEGLGHMPGTLHLDIDTTVAPVAMPPRRVPLALKSRLKDELDRLEALGVITKVTKPTDWVSNLVVSEKPNGILRVCIDPQHLNQALKRSLYPLPIIEDILPDLDDVKVFSKVDLKEGYLQIELDDESTDLTTFHTPWGRWKFLRMPFGIKPASEHFQHRFDQALEGLSGIYAVADDALVTGKGKTLSEATRNHDENMIALLKRCQECQIKLNADKFKFKCNEVTFIGHLLTPDGIRPDPAKIKAILEMEKPTDVSGVQRLIGMVKYLGKFLSSLSDICEPLRRLTHKDTIWHWKNEHDKAFQDIKMQSQKHLCSNFLTQTCHLKGKGMHPPKVLDLSYYKMAGLLHIPVGHSQQLNKITVKLKKSFWHKFLEWSKITNMFMGVKSPYGLITNP